MEGTSRKKIQEKDITFPVKMEDADESILTENN